MFVVINKTTNDSDTKAYKTKASAEKRAESMRRDYPEYEWVVVRTYGKD